MLVGMGASVQSLSVADISAREVDVRGVMRYCHVSHSCLAVDRCISHAIITDIPNRCRNAQFRKN